MQHVSIGYSNDSNLPRFAGLIPIVSMTVLFQELGFFRFFQLFQRLKLLQLLECPPNSLVVIVIVIPAVPIVVIAALFHFGSQGIQVVFTQRRAKCA